LTVTATVFLVVAVVPTTEIPVDPALSGVTVAVALAEPPGIVTGDATDATPAVLLFSVALTDEPPATCSMATKLLSAGLSWALATWKAAGPPATVVLKKLRPAGEKITVPEGTCVIVAVRLAKPGALAV
jgi:hypothetical protein